MFRQLLVCLLLVAFVSGQTTPPPAPAPAPQGAQTASPAPEKAPEAPAEVKVGPDDPVITIKGFCADTSLQGDACKTVITKAQFEKLADALQPNMAPAMRRQLATAYSRMLTMSTAAEKRGLDKTPHFDEATRFARMQILSQELSKSLQAESNNVTDQDIQDFYQKNAQNYDQATFARIFVPHSKRTQPAATPKKTAAKAGSAAEGSKTATTAAKPAAKKLSPEEEQKAGEEAMKKEANLLHARLVKGEDADKLQKEAYVAGGLPGTPPPSKMEKVRRPSLPTNHQTVMDLKPGEVSEVISDPTGNYIYKMISKETLPLDDRIKTEIKNQLSSQRYRDAMQQYQNNAELNDHYFGPGRMGMPIPPRAGKPPVQPRENDPD